MKNKTIDLHNALFAELEALQDMDSYTDEDGSLNREKIELAIKKADAVCNVSGKLLELSRLQLDAFKCAEETGIVAKMPEVFGIEFKDTKR